jgi:hypothetical protein
MVLRMSKATTFYVVYMTNELSGYFADPKPLRLSSELKCEWVGGKTTYRGREAVGRGNLA